MTTPLARRDSVRIVATDSGLGGLAVVADLAARLARASPFREAHLDFFNCRPGMAIAFDRMTSEARRIRVFSNALDAMTRAFAPDAILIACNSLSVLYARTPFAARGAPAPSVLDLTAIGTRRLLEQLEACPSAAALLFGAPTTVQSGVHRRALMAAGVAPERLVYQDCLHLPTAIEEGPEAPETRALVSRLVREAVQQAGGSRRPLVAALLCTHFGYARRAFEDALAESGATRATLLDPTLELSAAFLAGFDPATEPAGKLTVSVSSHVPLSAGSVEAIGRCLDPVSPETARALRRYTLRPNLFATE